MFKAFLDKSSSNNVIVIEKLDERYIMSYLNDSKTVETTEEHYKGNFKVYDVIALGSYASIEDIERAHPEYAL
jgi:hypothetical protein